MIMRFGNNAEPGASSLGSDLAKLFRETDVINSELAANLRHTAIRLAYEGFVVLRKDDLDTEALLEEAGYPDDVNPPTYLKLDVLASPSHDAAVLPTAVTYLLVREDGDNTMTGNDFDRIHVYLPVPDDFKLGATASELPPLTEVTSIWIELEKTSLGDSKNIRRFAITPNAVSEYTALADPASEFIHDQIVMRDEADRIAHYQRLGQGMLAQLLEDYQNFKPIRQG